jgi:hypothetical protein
MDEEDSLIPIPENAMSDGERTAYWGDDDNATVYLTKQIEDSNIRGFNLGQIRGRSGIIYGVIKDDVGRTMLNVDYHVPFNYLSARREDIPMVVETLRKRVNSDWEVLDYAARKRKKPTSPEELKPLIEDFKRQYGSSEVEHCRVIRDGKIIYDDTCGEKGSVMFGGDVRDADTIHNHPNNSPAMSESDVVLSVYGNARSVTSVTKDHGAWSLIRPESGWGKNPNTFNKDVSKEFKKSLNVAKKLPETQDLIRKIDSGEMPLQEADDIFNKKWVEKAINNVGITVHKHDAVTSFEGAIAIAAILGGALTVVALLSVICPKKT